MIRTCKLVNGEFVYDPPYTPEELEAHKARFADMCESHVAPGGHGTDRSLMDCSSVINHGLTGPTFLQEYTVNRARAAGINITGKVYKSGLADYRGPACPDAWISSVSDVHAVAERRNLTVQGMVNHKGREVPPKPDKPLSERLIREISGRYLAADPKWRERPKQELREMVVAQHGAPAAFQGAPMVPEPKVKKIRTIASTKGTVDL